MIEHLNSSNGFIRYLTTKIVVLLFSDPVPPPIRFNYICYTFLVIEKTRLLSFGFRKQFWRSNIAKREIKKERETYQQNQQTCSYEQFVWRR